MKLYRFYRADMGLILFTVKKEDNHCTCIVFDTYHNNSISIGFYSDARLVLVSKEDIKELETKMNIRHKIITVVMEHL